MKKTIIFLVALISMGVFAQHGPQFNHNTFNHRFTPQQNATLKTKRMALHLDLDALQQKKVYNLVLNQEVRFNKLKFKRQQTLKKGIKPTSKQQFNRINKGLDTRLNFRNHLKNILNARQYALFKKGVFKRMAFNHQKINRKKRRLYHPERPRRNRL